MGTTYQIKLGPNPAPPLLSIPELTEHIEIILNRVNQQMSTFLAESELSRFNRRQETNWFSVSPELAEVFGKANEISRRSAGAFDITVGPLVNLWGFGPARKTPSMPPDEEIARCLEAAGFEKLTVSQDPPRIRKAHPGIECDLSGIAKGYAVDRVSVFLTDVGLTHFLVEIGGEIRASGLNAQGQPWRIGIEHPGRRGEIYLPVSLRNRAMATSGDYLQNFEMAGQKYSHTIDPRTGRPVSHDVASVTVLAPSCAEADAWATALLVLGPEMGYNTALQHDLPVLMIIRSSEGFSEKMTPQFQTLLDP